MSFDSEKRRAEHQLMAYSAAAMLAAAGFVAFIERFTPQGPSFTPATGLAALALVPAVALIGPRLPRHVLGVLGPLGATLIASTLATANGYDDGAVLYVWPVLWMAYFFGLRGTLLIVGWVGIVHAIALASMPDGLGSLDQWIEVMVAMSVVAAVVRALSARNDRLLWQLAADARMDTLTGLLNRRGFEERIAVELARARREDYSLAVVALDIDHFKEVNDEHGHEAGDLVLARLGQVMREHTRGHDLAARLGGEEFVVVLPRAGVEEAEAFAERVRAGLSESNAPGVPRVTARAGVAAASRPSYARPLLAAADEALYEAKRAGRDQTVVAGTKTRVAATS